MILFYFLLIKEEQSSRVTKLTKSRNQDSAEILKNNLQASLRCLLVINNAKSGSRQAAMHRWNATLTCSLNPLSPVSSLLHKIAVESPPTAHSSEMSCASLINSFRSPLRTHAREKHRQQFTLMINKYVHLKKIIPPD